MIDRDGHTPDQILEVIQYIQGSKPGRDGFSWGDVVLSDRKLRHHMGPESNLRIKATRAKQRSDSKTLATDTDDINTCMGDLLGGEF